MAGPTLLLATSNPGKRAELLAFLPQGVTVLTLADVDLTMPPEDGQSFVTIARDKALFAASRSGLVTLADDSGLEVTALDGAPGVLSARFAGVPTNDARNRAHLLAKLDELVGADRSARFRCAVALATLDGCVAVGEGSCDGSIGVEEVGEHGFGYDPLFVLPDGRTMAQLEPEEKNRISHRAQAYRSLAPKLATWLATVDAGVAP